jgi:hypothetical protein
MPEHIGGMTFEGRYFIVKVPDGWKHGDPLPPPGPDDQWFDRQTDFKNALRGPWIRKPIRRQPWKADGPGVPDLSFGLKNARAR